MMPLGLIGWPLTYSLSPLLHTRWLKEADIDGRYDLWPTEDSALRDFVTALEQKGVHGFNITIPHKRAMMDLVDDISPEAQTINAINTVIFENGKRKGANTDITGVQNDLADFLGAKNPKTALLLGAGGAAAAVIEALRRAYPNLTLKIAARKAPKAVNALYIPWPEINTTLADIDLLINATPLGKRSAVELPLDWTKLKPSASFYDLNYHAEETALVHTARAKNHQARDGLGMLARQAQESFRLWTTITPTITPDLLSTLRSRDATAFPFI